MTIPNPINMEDFMILLTDEEKAALIGTQIQPDPAIAAIPVTPQELMPKVLVELAQARAEKEKAKEELASWMENPFVKAAQERVKEISSEEARLETQLRDLAVEIYLQDSSTKKLNEYVSIRENTELVYSKEQARNWAQDKLPQAITLDTKIFEKYARAVEDVSPLDFVQYDKRPTAAIAKDLSKLLA